MPISDYEAYDLDRVVRRGFPAELEEGGAEVETRQLADDEVFPALVQRLIHVTNEFGVDPQTDMVRKIAEISATLAEVQLAGGVLDSEISEERAKLVTRDGPIRPLTFITTVHVPEDSNLPDHPGLRDATPQAKLWPLG